MKIYNKKKFAFGLGMTVLGTANLILDIVNNSLDVKSVIIIFALYLELAILCAVCLKKCREKIKWTS